MAFSGVTLNSRINIGVISAHDALKYPERLAESERKMVEFARKQFLGTPQK